MEFLPDEVIFQFLLELNPAEINSFSQLNQRFREISSDEYLWQIKFTETGKEDFFEEKPAQLSYYQWWLFLEENPDFLLDPVVDALDLTITEAYLRTISITHLDYGSELFRSIHYCLCRSMQLGKEDLFHYFLHYYQPADESKNEFDYYFYPILAADDLSYLAALLPKLIDSASFNQFIQSNRHGINLPSTSFIPRLEALEMINQALGKVVFKIPSRPIKELTNLADYAYLKTIAFEMNENLLAEELAIGSDNLLMALVPLIWLYLPVNDLEIDQFSQLVAPKVVLTLEENEASEITRSFIQRYQKFILTDSRTYYISDKNLREELVPYLDVRPLLTKLGDDFSQDYTIGYPSLPYAYYQESIKRYDGVTITRDGYDLIIFYSKCYLPREEFPAPLQEYMADYCGEISSQYDAIDYIRRYYRLNVSRLND